MLTDNTATKLYEYRVEPGIKLIPIDPELPVITYFDRYNSFWDEYLSGKNIRIKVRKGGLGIYQFDVEHVREQMRQYDKRVREENKKRSDSKMKQNEL